ncbi:putative tail spike protein [Idiomarinaceae phage 1N2-2]|uniref:putative tail spike protein n=1 Tax=Idiomarinaceae phage 1N2-2 TaxID=1536592 RepID=UPI0004F8D5EC|nr:putative tail spike protein [Idiomarinaceae phage 1N2-2]AIM40728.1 putative tail spike protein [Idiomarinaceae phage 1N2-2]
MSLELEVWQAPIVDDEGNIQAGAQITVWDADTNESSTIYDDLDRSPKNNPFTVGSDGLARFYAEPGRYRIQAQSGSDIAVADDVDLSQKAHRLDLESAGIEQALSLRQDLENQGLPQALVLRSDLSSEDADKGGVLVRRNVIAVDSIADLLALPAEARRADLRVDVKGYHAGTDVGGGQFYWDNLSEDDADDGITFEVPGVAFGRWKRLYKKTYSLFDFGCRGDGKIDDSGKGTGIGTDDTDRVQLALNSCKELEGLGGDAVFKITKPLSGGVCKNLSDCTFDYSEGQTGGIESGLLYFEGVQSEEINCDPVFEGGTSILVSDASDFIANQFIFITSNDLWDLDDDMAAMGEMHEVESISGNEIAIKEPILYPMSDNVRVTRLSFNSGIVLSRVRAVGNSLQPQSVLRGFDFRWCSDVIVDNCDLRFFNDRGVSFRRCRNVEVKSSKIGDCLRDGTAYGVVVGQGTYSVKVNHNEIYNCRHGFDVGDVFGVSRYIDVSHNHMYDMRQHALSTHTASDFTNFNHNICTMRRGPLALGAIIRSINSKINDNTFVNPDGANQPAISVVPNPIFSGYTEINRNTIWSGVNGIGIRYINIQPKTDSLVEISGNNIECDGVRGVEARVTFDAEIDVLKIQNNKINGSLDGILIRTDGGESSSSIRKSECTGNSLITDKTGGRAIRVLVQSEGSVGLCRVQSNTASGGFTRGLEQLITQSGGAVLKTFATDNDFSEVVTPSNAIILDSDFSIVRDNINSSMV